MMDNQQDSGYRAVFDRAAAQGRGYLLMIAWGDQNCDFSRTYPLDDIAEIIPLCRELHRNRLDVHHVSGLFDLSRDYAAQAKMNVAEQLRILLPAPVLRDLTEEYKRIEKTQAQKRWDSQKWNFKLFSNRP